MKKRLTYLTLKIAELKYKLDTLDPNYWSYELIKSAYTGFLIHYEQERAELVSKLGRK